MPTLIRLYCCFRLQRYKLLKAIHNLTDGRCTMHVVVSDYKDTNFWKQFTTTAKILSISSMLFQTTKIQTFESNSQPHQRFPRARGGCFRLQRYKLLKAIHNYQNQLIRKIRLFQTTKIQTFESNSQPSVTRVKCNLRCFRLQRYKLLKAIHNLLPPRWRARLCCFRLQRYKLLKAIHNLKDAGATFAKVVSDYKDTNFWKQFTTYIQSLCPQIRCFRLQRYKLLKAIHNDIYVLILGCVLFQTTKIQTFESNSQLESGSRHGRGRCFRLQRYKLLKAIHN